MHLLDESRPKRRGFVMSVQTVLTQRKDKQVTKKSKRPILAKKEIIAAMRLFRLMAGK